MDINLTPPRLMRQMILGTIVTVVLGTGVAAQVQAAATTNTWQPRVTEVLLSKNLDQLRAGFDESYKSSPLVLQAEQARAEFLDLGRRIADLKAQRDRAATDLGHSEIQADILAAREDAMDAKARALDANDEKWTAWLKVLERARRKDVRAGRALAPRERNLIASMEATATRVRNASVEVDMSVLWDSGGGNNFNQRMAEKERARSLLMTAIRNHTETKRRLAAANPRTRREMIQVLTAEAQSEQALLRAERENLRLARQLVDLDRSELENKLTASSDNTHVTQAGQTDATAISANLDMFMD